MIFSGLAVGAGVGSTFAGSTVASGAGVVVVGFVTTLAGTLFVLAGVLLDGVVGVAGVGTTGCSDTVNVPSTTVTL